MAIDIRDVRFDTYTQAIRNGLMTMKLLHIPTGISVEGNNRGKPFFSDSRLRKALIEELETKVDKAVLKEKE